MNKSQQQGRSRTTEELLEILENQLRMLRRRCEAYDSGEEYEATSMATIMFNLFNDGGKSRALLTQMGLRRSIKFLSFAIANSPGNLARWAPLCMVRFSDEGGSYLPILDQGPPMQSCYLKFSEWWGQPVFENVAKQKLSRKNLVFALRSIDGGSHVDPIVPSSPYLELKEVGLGFMGRRPDGSPMPFKHNAHLATMRQMAFEVEESFRNAEIFVRT